MRTSVVIRTVCLILYCLTEFQLQFGNTEASLFTHTSMGAKKVLRKKLPIDDLPNLRLELLSLASGGTENTSKQSVSVSFTQSATDTSHRDKRKCTRLTDLLRGQRDARGASESGQVRRLQRPRPRPRPRPRARRRSGRYVRGGGEGPQPVGPSRREPRPRLRREAEPGDGGGGGGEHVRRRFPVRRKRLELANWVVVTTDGAHLPFRRPVSSSRVDIFAARPKQLREIPAWLVSLGFSLCSQRRPFFVCFFFLREGRLLSYTCSFTGPILP
jgi:hypothetical protein